MKNYGRANETTYLEISKSNFRPIKINIPLIEKKKQFFETVESLFQKIVTNLKLSRTLTRLMRGEIRLKDVEEEV
jgi:hypothetical protein